jgi:DNA-directed RNA polymerase I, II, and III subunit RPABC2
MDEYANDDYDDAVEQEEEMVPEDEGAEEEVEQSEQQRAEAADLVKLFRQHPEIWIPYSEQVQEQLNIKAPGESSVENASVSLRDLKTLDGHHTTYPFLTSYERTKCISFRACQIAHGAKPYIFVPEGVTDAYEIAKMELDAKRLPFIIKRPLPDGSFEVWRLSDLVVF